MQPQINSASWEIFHAFLSSAAFFQINVLETFFQEYSLAGQTDWIQIRPNVLSGLSDLGPICL